jgi:hypothetical protein
MSNENPFCKRQWNNGECHFGFKEPTTVRESCKRWSIILKKIIRLPGRVLAIGTRVGFLPSQFIPVQINTTYFPKMRFHIILHTLNRIKICLLFVNKIVLTVSSNRIRLEELQPVERLPDLKVKIQLSLCLPKYHAMKMYPLLNYTQRQEHILGEWRYRSAHS